MLIVSRDEEELEKSSFGRTSKESLGTRLEYRLLILLLQLSTVSIHERG